MRNIRPKELKVWLQQEAVFLLDVREVFEHNAFDIGGQLIPLGDIIGKAHTIPKNKPVIVYCRQGIRSQIAIQRLEDKFGFTNLFNLTGGMEAWKKSFL